MLWVAEVGSAHRGVPSLAYEFIRAFSEAGANVLKFQLGWTREAQYLQGLEYNPVRDADVMAIDVRNWCNYFGVKMMASIWSENGLETAKAVGIDYYKIGYRMKDSLLANKVQHEANLLGKPVFISGFNVHCISEYPTYPDRLKMPDRFGDIGYSDHTHGVEACLLAVARGATYIEKHVCLSKSDLITKDTPFSATPDEFETMVKLGNGIERILHATV